MNLEAEQSWTDIRRAMSKALVGAETEKHGLQLQLAEAEKTISGLRRQLAAKEKELSEANSYGAILRDEITNWLAERAAITSALKIKRMSGEAAAPLAQVLGAIDMQDKELAAWRETQKWCDALESDDPARAIQKLAREYLDMRAERDRLKGLLELKEQLLVCYRIGKQPSEKLLAALSKEAQAPPQGQGEEQLQ